MRAVEAQEALPPEEAESAAVGGRPDRQAPPTHRSVPPTSPIHRQNKKKKDQVSVTMFCLSCKPGGFIIVL